MSLSNKRTYVYAGVGGVCGVSAEKKRIGVLSYGIQKMAAFRDRSVSITFVIKPDIPCGGLWDGRGSLTSG